MRGFGLRHRGIHIGERERCSEKRRRRKSMEKNGQCGVLFSNEEKAMAGVREK